MKSLLLLSAAALLAGCATYHDQARPLIAQGRCAEARALVNQNEADPGTKAGAYGAIYADCDKNLNEAVRYFTLSARYGNEYGRQSLIRLRRPVPSPDLAPRAAPTSPTIVVQPSQPPAAAQAGSVNCTARQTSMGPPMMNKSYQVDCN